MRQVCSVLFKQSFWSRLTPFFASKTCITFLSPWKLISHPHMQTSPFHLLFSVFFFLLVAGNKHRGLCCAVLRVKTPHPTQQLNLMLGDETGSRCHPWPSLLKHYWPSQSGAHPGWCGGFVLGWGVILTGYFTISPLIVSLLTDNIR